MPTAALHVDLGRTPPSEFRIFRAGLNRSTKGDFLFDEAAATAVMSAFEEHGIDLSVDYDHHSLATAAGVKAVAAGWFGLEVRDGALWASNVRWTPEAEAHLRAREYAFFSPLFDFSRQSGRIEKLINCALSNSPALFNIDALVAASRTTHGRNPMTKPSKGQPQVALGMISAADRPKFFAYCEETGDTRHRSLGAALPASVRRGAPSSRSTVALSSQTEGTKTEEEKIAEKLGETLSPANQERLRAELTRGGR